MLDLVRQLVQLGQRVAFSASHGLFATPALGRSPGMAATDLDVPTEDACVADLERGDVGALTQPRLELRHVLRAALTQAVQFTELGVVFGAKYRAVLGL